MLAGTALGLVAESASAQNSIDTYTYDALGRLVAVSTSGGSHDNKTRSICYDSAGNRTTYRGTSDGSVATCVNTGDGSSNQPPVTGADAVSLPCKTAVFKNLVANDTDPEGNTPLVVQSITRTSGTATASVGSGGSTAFVDAGDWPGQSVFTYTVADSVGATSTGQLTVTVTGTAALCSGPDP
uniref:Ig-like domain-containing protein n=1 Tax=Pelagerythrobacter rhizovicinus TaxID=2268576 RepID=UPI001CDB65AA|nr:cadherin-like domain-containing protein [Pelagerythrobacter rhizovicinus]